ncbi:unnamed protein product [Porites lobata]|uniref:Major facilitator superfamily domain-containing protein 12 n=1 Tax=Porites lobata TaxID=104759 RepID=A0ABN8PP08_9CNID|nr:unnamed protein product [Porites lobata]
MKTLRKLYHGCTKGTDVEPRTPFIQRFACGVGHVINDIMRQLQFSFRLVFFMQVLGLSAENAGWLALQKKLALAFASPFSAFLVDRINIPFLSRKIGRRKSWHLVGTVLGVIFMPMFFSTCYACPNDREEWQKIVRLSIFNVILALSGSLLDIGHLTLIPVIAKDQIEAVELSALRVTFTFLSGIATYLVAWLVLGQDPRNNLSTESLVDFTIIAAISIAIGLIFSLIFHVGTKELSGEGNKETRKRKEEGNRLEEVKELPRETKISILMRLFYKLIGGDSKTATDMDGVNCTVPNDRYGNEDETEEKSHKYDSQSGSSLSSGVDNKGFLESCETESERFYPDQIKLEPAVEVNLNDSQRVGVNGKPSTNSDDPESACPSTSAPTMTLRAWLKNPHLYKVAIIFTCTFVLRNISYSYLPLFLTYRAHFAKESIAYLPLIMLSSGALSSAVSKRIVVKIGGKWTFILSALLVIGAGVWFYFISESNRVMTYPAVVLLGWGFSSMAVNSLAFATQLIGPNKVSN